MSFVPAVLMSLLVAAVLQAAEPGSADISYGNRMAADYFKRETAKISDSCLTNINSLADWQARRPELRRQAAEMLGLDPMPKRRLIKARHHLETGAGNLHGGEIVFPIQSASLCHRQFVSA